MEYRDRLDFYDHLTQIDFQKSYKKLLGRIPNGIILLDKTNTPVFYNRIISKIVAKRSGSSSQHSPNFDEQNPNLDEAKEV